MNNPTFKSDFLNEQLEEGNIAVKNDMVASAIKTVTEKSDAIVIEVFPLENFEQILQKVENTNKLRTKITSHLKKEGFEFFSFSGTTSGHYIR
jgi:hypothetical protein